MAVTKEDLEDFRRFVDEKLSNGGAESLTELAEEWENRCEHEQSVSDLRESIDQCDAGQGRPVDETFDDVRDKLD